MNIAYLRVSTGRQDAENQRFEINKFAKANNIIINQWVEEVVSGKKNADSRKLGVVVDDAKSGDIIICSEVSRLGRSLYDVMNTLRICMDKEIGVWTTKENYKLGTDVSSAILAFCFSLSASIERDLISMRTREALAYKKSQGIKLGRPKGSKNAHTKLSGKENTIIELINQGQSYSAIARIFHVDRSTLIRFLKNNGIYTPKNCHNKSTQIE